MKKYSVTIAGPREVGIFFDDNAFDMLNPHQSADINLLSQQIAKHLAGKLQKSELSPFYYVHRVANIDKESVDETGQQKIERTYELLVTDTHSYDVQFQIPAQDLDRDFQSVKGPFSVAKHAEPLNLAEPLNFIKTHCESKYEERIKRNRQSNSVFRLAMPPEPELELPGDDDAQLSAEKFGLDLSAQKATLEKAKAEKLLFLGRKREIQIPTKRKQTEETINAILDEEEKADQKAYDKDALVSYIEKQKQKISEEYDVAEELIKGEERRINHEVNQYLYEVENRLYQHKILENKLTLLKKKLAYAIYSAACNYYEQFHKEIKKEITSKAKPFDGSSQNQAVGASARPLVGSSSSNLKQSTSELESKIEDFKRIFNPVGITINDTGSISSVDEIYKAFTQPSEMTLSELQEVIRELLEVSNTVTLLKSTLLSCLHVGLNQFKEMCDREFGSALEESSFFEFDDWLGKTGFTWTGVLQLEALLKASAAEIEAEVKRITSDSKLKGKKELKDKELLNDDKEKGKEKDKEKESVKVVEPQPASSRSFFGINSWLGVAKKTTPQASIANTENEVAVAVDAKLEEKSELRETEEKETDADTWLLVSEANASMFSKALESVANVDTEAMADTYILQAWSATTAMTDNVKAYKTLLQYQEKAARLHQDAAELLKQVQGKYKNVTGFLSVHEDIAQHTSEALKDAYDAAVCAHLKIMGDYAFCIKAEGVESLPVLEQKLESIEKAKQELDQQHALLDVYINAVTAKSTAVRVIAKHEEQLNTTVIVGGSPSPRSFGSQSSSYESSEAVHIGKQEASKQKSPQEWAPAIVSTQALAAQTKKISPRSQSGSPKRPEKEQSNTTKTKNRISARNRIRMQQFLNLKEQEKLLAEKLQDKLPNPEAIKAETSKLNVLLAEFNNSNQYVKYNKNMMSEAKQARALSRRSKELGQQLKKKQQAFAQQLQNIADHTNEDKAAIVQDVYADAAQKMREAGILNLMAAVNEPIESFYAEAEAAKSYAQNDSLINKNLKEHLETAKLALSKSTSKIEAVEEAISKADEAALEIVKQRKQAKREELTTFAWNAQRSITDLKGMVDRITKVVANYHENLDALANLHPEEPVSTETEKGKEKDGKASRAADNTKAKVEQLTLALAQASIAKDRIQQLADFSPESKESKGIDPYGEAADQEIQECFLKINTASEEIENHAESIEKISSETIGAALKAAVERSSHVAQQLAMSLDVCKKQIEPVQTQKQTFKALLYAAAPELNPEEKAAAVKAKYQALIKTTKSEEQKVQYRAAEAQRLAEIDVGNTKTDAEHSIEKAETVLARINKNIEEMNQPLKDNETYTSFRDALNSDIEQAQPAISEASEKIAAELIRQKAIDEKLLTLSQWVVNKLYDNLPQWEETTKKKFLGGGVAISKNEKGKKIKVQRGISEMFEVLENHSKCTSDDAIKLLLKLQKVAKDSMERSKNHWMKYSVFGVRDAKVDEVYNQMSLLHIAVERIMRGENIDIEKTLSALSTFSSQSQAPRVVHA